jgi:hypothetical protein
MAYPLKRQFELYHRPAGMCDENRRKLRMTLVREGDQVGRSARFIARYRAELNARNRTRPLLLP